MRGVNLYFAVLLGWEAMTIQGGWPTLIALLLGAFNAWLAFPGEKK